MINSMYYSDYNDGRWNWDCCMRNSMYYSDYMTVVGIGTVWETEYIIITVGIKTAVWKTKCIIITVGIRTAVWETKCIIMTTMAVVGIGTAVWETNCISMTTMAVGSQSVAQRVTAGTFWPSQLITNVTSLRAVGRRIRTFQPCGALNLFGKIEINAPIRIVIIIMIIG